jgi:hypothetical protein
MKSSQQMLRSGEKLSAGRPVCSGKHFKIYPAEKRSCSVEKVYPIGIIYRVSIKEDGVYV